ncbi:MAG: GAF domain-containing protein [Ignavibacteriales bacterium]|nr:GAF domain-containing protein [Ignavibacteriales bacterium]MCB9218602.1 GAF domain-containing protein [Ignavibacteriales bacterium]MCB9259392.1 GAF domain-containing protein [Ignavibacteriales bacterium]
MILSSRNKKRILIFLIIPLLAIIPLLSDDIIIKSVSAAILVVYVAFIIFLRDSVRIKNILESNDSEDYYESDTADTVPETYDTDLGETVKIVSKKPSSGIITSQNYKPSIHSGLKSNISAEELKEQFGKIVTEELPTDVNSDEQFLFVLEKILNVIKDAYLAHSVIFFLYNENNQELTVQKYFSNSFNSISKKHFPLEDDIISKIVQDQEPVHLNEISPNAELDVIRYYDEPQGIKSLVGVPLFYADSLTGVLVVDSKAPDAFGIETVYSLGRFVRIIAIIISLFDEKFSGSTAEKRLETLLNILKTERKFDDENDIKETIETTIKNLLHYDAFTFVYFHPTKQKFIILSTENKTSLKYVGENLEIELDGTLVGKSILSGVPVNIEDTSDNTYKRFSKNENVGLGGSFLALPLIYDNQNFGVLCFESLKKKIYTNSDIKFMRNAVKIFSFFVYTYSTHSILKNLLSVDVETGALTYDAFIKFVSSDLVKAKEFDAPCALALIQIDDFLEERSLFETDPFPKVLSSINQSIKSEITPLNTLGRLGEKLFAVYFFNSSTKDVFLWAEKLRIKIARKPISVVSKQTTFTVSIGVASAHQKTDVEEVLKNAELALNKAYQKGGNTVKSIN